jgi:hypothetical protein
MSRRTRIAGARVQNAGTFGMKPVSFEMDRSRPRGPGSPEWAQNWAQWRFGRLQYDEGVIPSARLDSLPGREQLTSRPRCQQRRTPH